MARSEPSPGPTELAPNVNARMSELAARYALDPRQTRQLADLLVLLAADESAPTTVREASLAIDTHVADALAALDIKAVRDACTACDLGTGAGFPGLPLAVSLPDCHVYLIESAERKCRFLTRTKDALGAGNVEVVCARAEQWQAGIGRQDVAFARALAPGAVVVEYAAPLLRRGGLLIDWRGARDRAAEQRAAAAAVEVGLRPVDLRQVDPFPGADHHHLCLYVKVRDTPARFPRRAGIARKRPLGGSGSA